MLKAEGLTAIRGERLVFQNLSFSLAAGGALLLTGANGAGKSTVLRMLAGLARPAAGRLTWDGVDALDDCVAHGLRVALLGHQDALKSGLTAAENLDFTARLSGRDAAPVLASFGLAGLADLPARLLSAGQKRRLALARVSLSGAPLWLLDEPTLGLDDAAVHRLAIVLAAHRAAGGMVIAATHVALPLPDAGTVAMSPP